MEKIAPSHREQNVLGTACPLEYHLVPKLYSSLEDGGSFLVFPELTGFLLNSLKG